MSGPDLDGLFRPIEPPPGGLDRLRRRLAAERSSEPRRPLLGLAAAAALAGIAVFAVVTHRTPAALRDPRLLATPEIAPALFRLGVRAVPDEPATVPAAARGRIAVERVPLQSERTILYRVATVRG